MIKPENGTSGGSGNRGSNDASSHGESKVTKRVTAKKGKPRGIRKDRDCFTCRARDVKCDLNRPSCTPCIRDKLVCGGYPARIVWNPPIEGGVSKSRPKKLSVGSSVPAPTGVSLQATREQTSSSPETAETGSATTTAATSIPKSGPYAPPHTHTRTNSHTIHRQATASVPAPPSPSTKHTLLDSFEEITAPQSPAADERVNPMEVTYFSWGIKAIMKAFAHACRTDSRMESHEAIERSQILSMIWRFVSACLGQQDDKSELTALEIRTNAIEELQQLVHRGVIEAIFSILAFTYLDVCQGPFGVWHRHLQGARSLLDVHCANRDQLYAAFAATPGLQQAVTLLCWYDLMGSLALGDRPLIFENWHREAIEDSFFTLVNCPRDVLLLFQDLQNAAAAAARSPQSGRSVSGDSPALSVSASSAMSPPPPVPAGAVPDGVLLEAIRSASTMQVDTTSAVVAANNLWRLVPLLLAVTRRFGPASDATAQSIVSKVFALLERIPSETGISQHLAVVLFIISRHTRAECQRDMVRRYYRFWASEPFPLYPDALGRVEAMWAQS